MFGRGPTDKKPSLLMQSTAEGDSSHARASDDNVVSLNGGVDAVSTHRRAKAARKTAKKNPLLAALSGKSNEDTPQIATPNDDDLAAIDRDIEALISREHQYEQVDYEANENFGRSNYIQQNGDSYKPLLDPSIIFNSIWKWRWPIAGLTILGGIAGSFVALSAPQTYTAYTQLQYDPRAIKLVERDLTPEFLGNESVLALIDSQLEAVYSTRVLERVIEDLSLDLKPEFNGTGDDGLALFDGIGFVRSLFSEETPADVNDRTTLENLRSVLDAQRVPRTYNYSISAESEDPELAAEIANSVRTNFIEQQRLAQSGTAEDANNAIRGQLDQLRQAVEKAENEATAFANANGLKSVDGLTLNDTELVSLVNQSSEAKAATIRARSLAEAAQGASVDQVINGGLPPELVNSALITFRAQYSSLSQNAASLEQSLGPRHPRLANALAARESARDEINAELRRIVAGTQADLRRALQSEQQLTAKLNAARAGAGDENQALIKLRELEAEIEAAQEIYKAALLRARETEQLTTLATPNISLVSEALPPLHPSSLSRKVIAGTGAMGGMMLGLGLAFLFGLRDSLRADSANNTRGSQAPTAPKAPNPNSPSGRRPRAQRTQNQSSNQSGNQAAARSENTMYPGAPYSPYAAMQQPQSQTYAQQPQQQAMAQPQTTFAPQYPQQPMMQPAPAHYPHQQMAMPYPPMQPAMHQPMQASVMPHAVMQPQPYPQPAPQMMQPQFVDPYAQAAAQQQQQEEAELAELRASVREIRDVVDHLAQSRGSRRRFG